VHVLVSLEREGSVELDAFTRKIRSRPEVRRAWYVTGDTDFVLLLQLSDMEAYEAFAQQVFHDDPNVTAFRTLIVMREVVGITNANGQGGEMRGTHEERKACDKPRHDLERRHGAVASHGSRPGHGL